MDKYNIVHLRGVVKTVEEVDIVNGNEFTGYSLIIETERKSGVRDETVVLVDKATAQAVGRIEAGMILHVEGETQTMKHPVTEKVLVCVIASEAEAAGSDEEQENGVLIKGIIAKIGAYRATPAGKHITDFFVRVPKGADYSYLPCIAWGKTAVKVKEKSEGQMIDLVGRLQSRQYNKKNENGEMEVRTTYEVSVYHVEKEGMEA